MYKYLQKPQLKSLYAKHREMRAGDRLGEATGLMDVYGYKPREIGEYFSNSPDKIGTCAECRSLYVGNWGSRFCSEGCAEKARYRRRVARGYNFQGKVESRREKAKRLKAERGAQRKKAKRAVGGAIVSLRCEWCGNPTGNHGKELLAICRNHLRQLASR